MSITCNYWHNPKVDLSFKHIETIRQKRTPKTVETVDWPNLNCNCRALPYMYVTEHVFFKKLSELHSFIVASIFIKRSLTQLCNLAGARVPRFQGSSIQRVNEIVKLVTDLLRHVAFQPDLQICLRQSISSIPARSGSFLSVTFRTSFTPSMLQNQLQRIYFRTPSNGQQLVHLDCPIWQWSDVSFRAKW
jgi:hypothetical protein